MPEVSVIIDVYPRVFWLETFVRKKETAPAGKVRVHDSDPNPNYTRGQLSLASEPTPRLRAHAIRLASDATDSCPRATM